MHSGKLGFVRPRLYVDVKADGRHLFVILSGLSLRTLRKSYWPKWRQGRRRMLVIALARISNRRVLKLDEPKRDDAQCSGAPHRAPTVSRCGPRCNLVSIAARPAKVSDLLVHTGAQTIPSCVDQPRW